MITLKQGDIFPDITATVLNENDVVVDVTGATITCSCRSSRDPTTRILDGSTGVVVDGPTGRVAYQWDSGESDVEPGSYEAEFKVVPPSGEAYRVPTSGYITVIVESRIGSTA